MSSSNLIRWGGLAAVVAALLFIIANLVALFSSFTQGPIAVVTFQSILAAIAEVLLLLGLVALYTYQFEAVGIEGLVVFLITFAGVVWAQGGLIWASFLTALGWALFGIVTLGAGVYPRAAAIGLIIGGVLYGIANALLGSVSLMDNPVYAVVAVIFAIIFYASIGWLGYSLYTERVQQPTRES